MQSPRTNLPSNFLPEWLLPVLLLEWAALAGAESDLDVVELFAGEAEVSKSCEACDLKVVAVDALHGTAEANLQTLRGVRYAISMILRLKAGALLWLAPPCSGWVFLSSSCHKRNSSNDYRGNRRNPGVAADNSLAHVVAALCRLASWWGITFILEQPADSVLFNFGCVKKALNMCGAIFTRTFAQAFDPSFPIRKPFRLAATAVWASSLRRNKPWTSTVGHGCYTVDSDGRVSGHRSLSETAAYPHEFGQAAAGLAWQLSSSFVSDTSNYR